MEYRIEHDSMGEMKVPADRLWAAQTQRSHENFEIGVGIETMPKEIIHAFGVLKKAAAITNNKLRPEKMTAEKLGAIMAACDEVMAGTDEAFPMRGPDGTENPCAHSMDFVHGREDGKPGNIVYCESRIFR